MSYKSSGRDHDKTAAPATHLDGHSANTANSRASHPHNLPAQPALNHPLPSAQTQRNEAHNTPSGNYPHPRPANQDDYLLGLKKTAFQSQRIFDDDYEMLPDDKLGEETAPNARVWRAYEQEALVYDTALVGQARDGLDVMLVFAGLFSAVVTSFLVQVSQNLQPDFSEMTALLLHDIVVLQIQAPGNTSITLPSANPSASFEPGALDIWMNGLWAVSLTAGLAVALSAVLIKQWLHRYTSLPSGTPGHRSHIRQFRFIGFEKWHVEAIIGTLPVVMNLSLGLFLIGLILFFIQLRVSLAYSIGAISTAILVLYVGSNIMPLFDPQCPYQTPLTDFFPHLASTLMAVWRMAVGKVREVLQRALTLVGYDRDIAEPLPRKPSFEAVSLSYTRQREKDAVTRTYNMLSVDGLDWVFHVTTNPSLHNIVFYAIPGLASTSSTEMRHRWMNNDDFISRCTASLSAVVTENRLGVYDCRPGCEVEMERLVRGLTMLGVPLPGGNYRYYATFLTEGHAVLPASLQMALFRTLPMVLEVFPTQAAFHKDLYYAFSSPVEHWATASSHPDLMYLTIWRAFAYTSSSDSRYSWREINDRVDFFVFISTFLFLLAPAREDIPSIGDCLDRTLANYLHLDRCLWSALGFERFINRGLEHMMMPQSSGMMLSNSTRDPAFASHATLRMMWQASWTYDEVHDIFFGRYVDWIHIIYELALLPDYHADLNHLWRCIIHCANRYTKFAQIVLEPDHLTKACISFLLVDDSPRPAKSLLNSLYSARPGHSSWAHVLRTLKALCSWSHDPSSNCDDFPLANLAGKKTLLVSDRSVSTSLDNAVRDKLQTNSLQIALFVAELDKLVDGPITAKNVELYLPTDPEYWLRAYSHYLESLTIDILSSSPRSSSASSSSSSSAGDGDTSESDQNSNRPASLLGTGIPLPPSEDGDEPPEGIVIMGLGHGEGVNERWRSNGNVRRVLTDDVDKPGPPVNGELGRFADTGELGGSAVVVGHGDGDGANGRSRYAGEAGRIQTDNTNELDEPADAGELGESEGVREGGPEPGDVASQVDFGPQTDGRVDDLDSSGGVLALRSGWHDTLREPSIDRRREPGIEPKVADAEAESDDSEEDSRDVPGHGGFGGAGGEDRTTQSVFGDAEKEDSKPAPVIGVDERGIQLEDTSEEGGRGE